MPIVRRVQPTDLLSLNLCNLDPFTENYDLSFYLSYLMKWPSLFQCVEDDRGQIVAYSIGKLETSPPHHPHPLPWHGHITVLTVSPQHRRQGYARLLTDALETSCNAANAFFVDLYVRESNKAAINMYKKMGYSVYRRVVKYYSEDLEDKGQDGEDAFDMRKPLDRDKQRKYVREGGEEYRVTADEVF